MLILLVLHGFGESVLDFNPEFTGGELLVADVPVSCLDTLDNH